MLLLLPVIDNIYKYREDTNSPAVWVRAVIVFLMVFILFRIRPLGYSQHHIVRSILLFLAYIVIISYIFSPEKWVFYILIRISYSFIGFILFTYLAKNSDIEKSFSTFFMFLIVVLAICVYMNVDQRMDTIKELNEADNTGYALLCAFAGVMLLTKRRFYLLAVFLVFVGTMISGKRGAILGLALSSIPLVFYIFTSYSSSLIRKGEILVIMALAAILALHWFGNLFDASIIRMENIAEDGGSGRNVVYLKYWSHFTSANLTHQLLGHGLYAGIYGSGSKYAFSNVLAHNDWLELLFDFGLVGVILYFLIIIKIFLVIVRNRNIKNIYYYMLLISFIVWLVKSIVSSTFLMDVNSIYLYMTTAYAMAKLKPSTQNSVNPQSAFQTHL